MKKTTFFMLFAVLSLPMLMSSDYKQDPSSPQPCYYLIHHITASGIKDIQTTSVQSVEAHKQHGDAVEAAICNY